MIVDDCAVWSQEVEPLVPSVVVAATGPDGHDASEVAVLVDGERIADRLDGKPLDVDPGEHTFRFELPGAAAIEQRIVIREGEHARSIAVTFPAPKMTMGLTLAPTPAEPGAAPWRPIPPSVYVLGAVGAVGIASFSYFAIAGDNQRANLNQLNCKPNCQPHLVNLAWDDFITADVSLGVSVVALGLATYFFFSRPSRSRPALGFVDLVIEGLPSRRGSAFGMRGSF
jgi:hypothetical protein